MAVLTREKQNKLIECCSEDCPLSATMHDESLPEVQKKNLLNMFPSSKKFVRFSNVTLREYPIVVGDNPAVSCGPPISIDWKYISEVVLSVEEHMSMNPNPKKQREMILPSYIRKMILIHNGSSDFELEEAEDEAKEIKIQRHKSWKDSKMINIQMLFNWTGRKFQEIRFNTKKKCYCPRK